ncbi:trans-sialidase, putative, partial [Trypanosoma cruzi marinkellei]
MSRRVFTSALLLLLVVMMCCGIGGAANAVESRSGDAQQPQWADIFVPGKTQVVAKDGSASGTMLSFNTPSLSSAGGVMAVFAQGVVPPVSPDEQKKPDFETDVVAGYINSAWDWSSLVAEVNMNTWRAYAILGIKREADLVGIAFNPTTIAKGNKVFLLVGRGEKKYDNNTKNWKLSDPDIQLVVGEATQFKEGEQSGKINWSGPVSLLKQITDGSQSDAKVFYPGGGTGVLMEDGTLV